ncbi:MAG: hypothetical protein CO094_07275 [Anaerolineae bacterium CG_4_9_14_3_um_filter_57_17]|nr:hypothetical protein [bacterium]NCT21060.1 hypothetical protein [bacterium]OIO87470.1 MAG: hypothetical protein AUK01_00155 [Anaerolineae bacterium CG2_30_57_67]PJB66382.1 MAG: hypothetical protein CO094_07275 [Anaerolineae bacterium CG_4_9_14_3_um_filter_57_17]
MKRSSLNWIFDLLLIVVLATGGYLRVIGLNWDESQHLHPDERFMTMVTTSLSPATSVGNYFDTANSHLNPANTGYTFFVYGTFPLFLTRYVGEWVAQTGYDEITLVGRQLSALADLLAVLALYLLTARLYGRKTAFVAAAFSAFAVMQIQESHFYTVDNYATLFMTLAAYFAVRILTQARDENQPGGWRNPDLWNSVLFGLATGLAIASKINAAPVAILLPGAFLLRWLSSERGEPKAFPFFETATFFVIVGAVFTLLAFRIGQPYAFSGPGFFGVSLNPQWVATIAEQRAQASGDVDFPPALQWARRPFTFLLENMVIWGLGWPLGLTALAGAAWMAWEVLRKQAWKHLLLLGWLAFYVLWQMTQWNPTMRYQLPAYPLMALMAAWGLVRLGAALQPKRLTFLAGLLTAAILLATFGWAYAFTRIYTRPHTRVAASRWIFEQLPGPITLGYADGAQPLPIPAGLSIVPEQDFITQFVPFHAASPLTKISLGHAAGTGQQTVRLTLASSPDFPPESVLAQMESTANFAPQTDPRGAAWDFPLQTPLSLAAEKTYYLRIQSSAPLTIIGAAPINESSWDDGLPLRMDGYDAYGGIYQGELNLEMYWDDNADKLLRFETNLDQGDYLFISSNRQWGTTVRVPERYPLTTVFYRALLGCPAGADVLTCYREARPGMFTGQLGYELVQTFESYPTLDLGALGKYEFNTQYAEEAFTVYDHPKVLIFKKTASYNPQSAHAILDAVDLTQVVHLTPRQAGKFPSGQMAPRVCWGLPGLCQFLGAPEASGLSEESLSLQSFGMKLSPERLAVQQAGGTWSALFSYQAIQNRFPLIGLLLWYGFLALLGALTYPLMRAALPGLGVNAWAFARTGGLVLLAWLSWFPASVGGVYTRFSIGLAVGLILISSAFLFLRRRRQLSAEMSANRRRILLFEAVFLIFFLVDFFIRVGNPDLWHPGRGGERPMDFSYLNAVLKSTTFPPYDPWFAGGYINYYYYGYVLVGTPVKLLGIVPSIAYNFILPTLYALIALGGFGVAFTLVHKPGRERLALTAGLAAAVGLVLIGNLGTIQLIFQALQKMAVPSEQVSAAGVWIFQRWGWAAQGIFKLLTGQGELPIGWGEWYWNPSRVIPSGPGNEITEFPLFTFLYSDLHAHMISLPLATLMLGWALSTLRARRLSWLRWLATLAFGGLVIGAFRPTNTWDFPTYLLFAALVTGYSLFRHGKTERVTDGETEKRITDEPENRATEELENRSTGTLENRPTEELEHWSTGKLLPALAGMATLTGFALVLYAPYAQWFGLGYSNIQLWEGDKTPIWSYLTMWLPFLFVIFFWLLWETRQWMAQTPLSALRSFLSAYQPLVSAAGLLALALTLGTWLFFQVTVALIALPLLFWTLILLLRPRLPDAKRLTLFMAVTALALTVFVELVVLSGDIGRMNTIFKLYLQAWVFLAVASGAAFAWTLAELKVWRGFWQTGVMVLFAGAFLFTITASGDKIRDRISPTTPLTLDSMEYMLHSIYWDGQDMDLSQDYRAIRWLQDNVSGSPVIVEGYTSEYRWGARYAIYTGLPDVLGWNWHQRQQRTLTPETWVFDRANAINAFYETTDLIAARAFLREYNARYIVVGQMERNYYQPAGLAKFESQNGTLWREVYRDGLTVIYEVLP